LLVVLETAKPPPGPIPPVSTNLFGDRGPARGRAPYQEEMLDLIPVRQDRDGKVIRLGLAANKVGSLQPSALVLVLTPRDKRSRGQPVPNPSNPSLPPQPGSLFPAWLP
jgi:hypothetical protein